MLQMCSGKEVGIILFISQVLIKHFDTRHCMRYSEGRRNVQKKNPKEADKSEIHT